MSQTTGRSRARASVHARGLPRHLLPGQQLPGQQLPGDRSSYDVKFNPGNQSLFAADTSRSHMTPSSAAAAAADSSVGFNFSAYPHVLTTSPFTAAAAAGDGRHTAGADVPPFSASEHDGFANTVPPGFGFDGMFPSDTSNSSGGVQPGSFADINPSLEFGFLLGFNSSTTPGGGFAPSSGQNVSGGDVKTESLDDDVIFVEDDPADPPAADGGGGGGDGGGGGGDDDTLPGAAVQQITRRVTITTNIQGQNVKYEQVQHAVATLPAPVVPSNSASFQSCINSTTSSSSSQFEPDNISDPSLLTNSIFHQPATQPVYDFSTFPHTSTSADVSDTKPGWDVLSGDVLNELASSASYSAPAAVTSPPYHQLPPQQTAPRPAKRMTSPRSNVASSHMHPAWRASPVPMSPMSSATPGSVRTAGPRAAQPHRPASAKKSSSVGGHGVVGGLPLSDVGVGGGRVEDGTAWSMVARFVCSVPGCGASFTRKQNLLRHQTQKHGRAKATSRGPAPADDDDDDEDDDSGMMPAFF